MRRARFFQRTTKNGYSRTRDAEEHRLLHVVARARIAGLKRPKKKPSAAVTFMTGKHAVPAPPWRAVLQQLQQPVVPFVRFGSSHRYLRYLEFAFEIGNADLVRSR